MKRVRTKLSLANVCPVCIPYDEFWVVANLLQRGQKTRIETGLHILKGHLSGDTNAFDRCVHIPYILITLKSQSPQHKIHSKHYMLEAKAFILRQRPGQKCVVNVTNLSGVLC